MVSTEQITKFQSLYRDRFGKELSESEASEKGDQLIRLVGLIYRPMTEEESKRLQLRRKETGNISN